MQPGRIDKNHLILVHCLNTQYLLPRCLRLARGNAEFLLKNKIEQR